MPTDFVFIVTIRRRRYWSNYSRRSRSDIDHVEKHIVRAWQAASWWATDLSGANSATVWVAMCQCEGLLCCVGAVCVCVWRKYAGWPFFVSIHTYTVCTVPYVCYRKSHW